MDAANRDVRRRRLQSYDPEDVVKYLSDLAKRLGKDSLTGQDITDDGEISRITVSRKFGGLSKALIKAGLKAGKSYKRDRQRMLKELAKLMKQLGREPKCVKIDRHLSYKWLAYKSEFGDLRRACDLAEELLQSEGTASELGALDIKLGPATSPRRRQKYGPAIQFRSFRHAPINEQGIVFLFGMLAAELGFEVENIQDGYPDCDAKLRKSDGTLERIAIEFEFKSSHFVQHQHDPEKCDVIVCWEHDWQECPSWITVIELSSVILQC